MYNFTKQYDFIKDEIKEIPEFKNKKLISKASALKEFLRRTRYAVKLTLTEKEIFTFALLQLITIVAVYYLWFQFLGWIPQEIWNNENKLADLTLNLVFLLWSFLCVGLASFPLGILSGCMGAAHFLRKQGKKSTIAVCLKMILPGAKELWIFSWADGWFTVNRILDRLPKKRWRWNIAAEVLYFAWKVATVGMLPSIIVGRKIVESGK